MANYSPEARTDCECYARYLLGKWRRGVHPLDLADIVDAATDRLPPEGYKVWVRFYVRKALCDHYRIGKPKGKNRPELLGKNDELIADGQQYRPTTLPRCYVRLVGDNLNYRRTVVALSLGMSNAEIAEALGVGRSTVNGWRQSIRRDLAIMSPHRSGPLTKPIQALYRAGRLPIVAGSSS